MWRADRRLSVMTLVVNERDLLARNGHARLLYMLGLETCDSSLHLRSEVAH
jgi:hypothetical protein